jgi:hypothetical protein
MKSQHYLNRCAEKLADEGWEVGRPQIAQVFRSVDGTERYLVQCGGRRGSAADRGNRLDA